MWGQEATDMIIKEEVLHELLCGYEKPEDLLGDDGLLKRLKKALIERALGAGLSAHLGHEKDPLCAHAPTANTTTNSRHSTDPPHSDRNPILPPSRPDRPAQANGRPLSS
jgi:hypothetical protein